MESASQVCPSCKSSKYNNPQLRLMVNVCGHSLCENCVEVLFVRGSGLCVQCKTPIRKANFRYQLFEDPAVQKEVDIRKKILTEFNKREEDFGTVEEYDKYLEMIEDIIYKLCNDVDTDKTRKFIEQYKKDNKDVIKRNRTKQSTCAEFYERELERERVLRERLAEVQASEEAADLLRRKRLHAARTLQGFLCGPAAIDLPEEPQNIVKSHNSSLSPSSNLPQVVVAAPPSAMLESKHRFLPPPSASLFNRPTPSTVNPRWLGLSLAPVSAMAGIPQLLPSHPPSSWATSSEHHSVVIPHPPSRNGGQNDTIVLSRVQVTKPSSLMSTTETTGATRSLKEWLEPYVPELCGPQPPGPTDDPRWGVLELVYLKAIVEPTTTEVNAANDADDATDSIRTSGFDGEGKGDGFDSMERDDVRRGVSHELPRGTCGIAPSVYMSRALQDSRCGLFI